MVEAPGAAGHDDHVAASEDEGQGRGVAVWAAAEEEGGVAEASRG
jgi:hypothetical protein